jgi:hypothetical protein
MGEAPNVADLHDEVHGREADGGTLTGTATMGDWPGVAPISDGVINGDHFSFVAIGQLISSSGYPRMGFDGTVTGDTMKLTMTLGYVGDSEAAAKKLPMEGKKIK